MSVNTVRKYIKDNNPPEFKVREYKPEILEYSEIITEMLKKGFIGTRIYEEIKKLGYKREISNLYRYLRETEQSKKDERLITTRFETCPGKQMQYDWKEWYLPVKGKKIKIYIHDLILSYSRYKYCTFSLSIGTMDVIRAIKEGIDRFGGIASELLIDNPKQMIITHESSDSVRYNDEFLKFCGLYGINPSPCKPYRARTKGKIERPFYYIQEHLLRGLDVDSLSEFGEKLSAFIDKYNDREHSTLKEKPNNRYWDEIESLKEIPKVEPTKVFSKEVRKVSNDGYVSFNGSYYPVAMKYALKMVFCESIFGFKLKIYDEKGQLILETETKSSKEKPKHSEHEEINQRYQLKRERAKKNLLEKFKNNFSDVGEQYYHGLRREHAINAYWHMSEILAYLNFYSEETVKQALEKCLLLGSYHKNSVKRLLSVDGIKPVLVTSSVMKFENSVDITRPLSVYGGLV